MKFALLTDVPHLVPVIARWYFDEWGHGIADNSFEKTCVRLNGKLNRDVLPIHVIALHDGQPLGVAQLKPQEMHDLFPERTPWLGGVYVPSSARNRGVASALARQAALKARSLQINQLYLQTLRLDGGLYAPAGWQPLEQVTYQGLDILVMKKTLC
ncbi:MAG: GNAT family N-acetyltransferase [Pseudomonadota bacterium]